MIETTRSTEPSGAFERIGWRRLALVGVGVAALVIFTLRALLFARVDVLPGTDASNLYAWELYTRAVFASGRLPHWNPYLFSGTPHLADTETTVLYPPAMLLRWIPPAAFLSWMAVLHIWIGGVGTAVLGRVIGLGWWPVAGAAIAVSLGGSVPAWVFNGHLLLLYGSSWLPWVLAFVMLSARRCTPWPHPGLVLVLALQFLAGYLQGSVYIVSAAMAAVAWLVLWPAGEARGVNRWLPAAQFGIGSVLAAGLVAFQLLPTLQLVGQAGRISGIPYSTAVRGAWTIRDLGTFFFPFSGIPVTTPMRFMGDHTAYVGWVLAILAAVALIGRRHRRAALFFSALAVVSMACVMADTLPLYRIHFLLFPSLRVPGRMLFVTTLAVAMLGAIGLDHLSEVVSRRHRLASLALVAVLVALVTVDVAAYSRGASQPMSPAPAPATLLIPAQPGRTLSVCDRALGAMDLVIAGRPAADGAGGVFLSDYGSFQELAQQDGPLRMRRDLLDLTNVTTVVSCAALREPGLREIDRADVGILYHNESAWPRGTWTCRAERVTRREAIEHLRQIHYDGQHRLDRRYFVNIRWAATVDEPRRLALESRYHLAEGTARDGNTWRYDLQDRSGSNVKALLADSAVEDTHGIDRETGDVAAAAGDVEDQVLFGTGACDHAGQVTGIEVDQPGGDVTMVSNAPVDGFLFMSEPYYLERSAYVDGIEVMPQKADVAFMVVPVPAGRHLVQVRYVPRRFRLGLAITAFTIIGWVGIAVWMSRRRRPGLSFA